MAKRSAGLLIYRIKAGHLEVLLVHPGGPLWSRKDATAWSIPKGLIEEDENELAAAKREAAEELGSTIGGQFKRLGEYRQPGGKVVIAWSVKADLDADTIASNTFQMEWPPKSGQFKTFPEVDRAEWFGLPEAEQKMLKGQRAMLADLQASIPSA
jgi:predicted NUDIX family NTP pyrophosphohydrolase